MPTVVFESGETRRIEMTVDEEIRLVDLCDETSAPVPFSCRSASCGTCRVLVLAGAELLAPPREDEVEVLAVFGDDPARTRLACQARVKPGPGIVRLRPAG